MFVRVPESAVSLLKTPLKTPGKIGRGRFRWEKMKRKNMIRSIRRNKKRDIRSNIKSVQENNKER